MVGVFLGEYSILTNLIFDGFSYNFTMYHDTIYLQKRSSELKTNVYAIAFCMVKAYFFFCLRCYGDVQWFYCSLPVQTHRRMDANRQPLSCLRLINQVRVTITGILQEVLYVFCAMWAMYIFHFFSTFSVFMSFSSHFTVMNFCVSGIMFILGVGQAVFRQRAAGVWHRADQWWKAP